jgi:hypothetical protein
VAHQLLYQRPIPFTEFDLDDELAAWVDGYRIPILLVFALDVTMPLVHLYAVNLQVLGMVMVEVLAMTTNRESNPAHCVRVGLGKAGGAFEGATFCELSTDLDGSLFWDLAVP